MGWVNGEPAVFEGGYALRNGTTGEDGFAVWSGQHASWTVNGPNGMSDQWLAGSWPDGWLHARIHLHNDPATPAGSGPVTDLRSGRRAIRAAMLAKTSPDMGTTQCEQVLLLAKSLAALSR